MDFRSLAKSSWLVPLSAFLLGIAGLYLMPALGVLALIAMMLLLVARFDNDAGTFLPLAVLFVIVLATLVLLVGGLAFVHALMSG